LRRWGRRLSGNERPGLWVPAFAGTTLREPEFAASLLT
jgi:hypothetical protein